MKSLRVGVATLGLLAGVLAGSAQAAPTLFFWNLDFTQGPLTGQDFQGTLSVNGCGGICSGNFTTPPPATPLSLVSLNITVGGVAFAINNDTGFGTGFPDVTFDQSGHISAIDYQGVVTVGGNTFVLDTSGANIGENVAFYRGALGAPVFGSLSIARLAVPEPGTIPLLGAALIGVFLVGRRRLSQGAASFAA
jgi:hypothetical protein